MKLEDVNSAIIEMSISEGVKNLCLFTEDKDIINYVNDFIEKDEQFDISDNNELFFEALLPYFEDNLKYFVTLDEIDTPPPQGKVKYFMGLLGKKLNPTSLSGAVVKGYNKAAFVGNKISKTVATGISNAKTNIKTLKSNAIKNTANGLKSAGKTLTTVGEKVDQKA